MSDRFEAFLRLAAAFFRAENERLRAVLPWRNYRLLSGLLLILTAVVVIAFR